MCRGLCLLLSHWTSRALSELRVHLHRKTPAQTMFANACRLRSHCKQNRVYFASPVWVRPFPPRRSISVFNRLLRGRTLSLCFYVDATGSVHMHRTRVESVSPICCWPPSSIHDLIWICVIIRYSNKTLVAFIIFIQPADNPRLNFI